MSSLNYFNLLVDNQIDDNQLNFKESLKYNKYGYEFSKLLNSWNFNGIDFEINTGFNCQSKDVFISTFKKITLKMDKRNYDKLKNKIESIISNTIIELIHYDEENEILTIIAN